MAFIASQLAVMPHAHGAGQQELPRDHDALPHIHISWFGHVVHCHHDCPANDDEHDADHSNQSSFDSVPGHDHDSDAIYLPNDGGVSLPIKNMAAPNYHQVVSPIAILAVQSPATVCARWTAVDFPDSQSPGCPLYLALRALRI